MHLLGEGVEVGGELAVVVVLLDEEFFLVDGVPGCEVDELEALYLVAEGLVVEDDLLVVEVGEEHLVLEDLADGLVLVAGDDLHPLLEALPLAEHDEEVVLADLVERLHLLEPLLHRDELRRLRVHELAHPLAAESVVVLHLLADDLRVRHHLHVVVVVLVLTDHVDELVRCQLLLPHHVEERGHLLVRLLRSASPLRTHQAGRDGLHLDVAGDLDRGAPQRPVLVALSALLVEGSSSRGSPRRSDTDINGRDFLVDGRALAASDQRQHLLGLLLSERFFLGLLGKHNAT